MLARVGRQERARAGEHRLGSLLCASQCPLQMIHHLSAGVFTLSHGCHGLTKMRMDRHALRKRLTTREDSKPLVKNGRCAPCGAFVQALVCWCVVAPSEPAADSSPLWRVWSPRDSPVSSSLSGWGSFAGPLLISCVPSRHRQSSRWRRLSTLTASATASTASASAGTSSRK